MSGHRMQWDRLLSTARVGFDGPSPDVRSQFQRDVDRILFSDAFRRLGRKTQVHPLNENDHIHSRLTHSLEVSSVGRSLGEAVGVFLRGRGELPGELSPHHVGQVVQAACLAHDIGNPPFGHSGESAIKDWFASHAAHVAHLPVEQRSDFTKFDGNAMSVRVLLSTGFYGQGMSPTHAVLGALLKYPWPSSFDAGKDKFSFFQAEAPLVREAAEAMGMPELDGRFARHPLAHLAEASDDICYRIIDMEDATELGILDEGFMLQSFGPLLGIEEGTERWMRYAGWHFRQRNSVLRAKLMGLATDEVLALFREHYEEIMTGALDHHKGLMDLAKGGALAELRRVYASIGKRLFLSRRKVILELGAQNVLGGLLDMTAPEMARLCTGEKSFGREHVKTLFGAEAVERAAEGGDCAYAVLLLLLDYVAGMTDHYAADLGRRLRGDWA
ncbi:dGTP triphosphohydrolase [Desulfocurvus sp. DL9XJH121]